MPTNTPTDILQARLASGEITVEEYRQLLAELQLTQPRGLQGNTPPALPPAEPDAGYGRVLATVDDLIIYERAISHRDTVRSIKDVAHVFGNQSSYTFNFVPFQRSTSLIMTFVDGKSIYVSEDRAWFGGRRHAELAKALLLVRRLTLNARAINLVLKLRRDGQVLLSKPIGKGAEPVTLYLDGTVGTPTRRIDIKRAKESGTFGIGTEWHSINGMNTRSDPYEVVLSEERGLIGALIPRNSIRFTPFLQDVDAIHAVLNWLSKPGNTLRTMDTT